MGWFGRWTRPVRAVTRVTVPLLWSAKARAAVKRLSKRLPGSHREPDSDGRCLVIAAARSSCRSTSSRDTSCSSLPKTLVTTAGLASERRR
jgi:hypothetical protein